MAYSIAGLPYAPFAPLFALDASALADRGARLVIADADHIFPCRVSLEDARVGDRLLLTNYTSHDVATPYRCSYAVIVREDAVAPQPFVDSVPAVFEGRPLGLRGFDGEGNLVDARLALPGGSAKAILELLSLSEIAYIDAHNAAHGCFAARIQRNGNPIC
jgi:hypothetical protein